MKNPDITDHKFVLIVNKSIPIGNAMNAIGHMALSLANQATSDIKKEMIFTDFVDSDNTIHPSVSALSLFIQ